MLEPHGEIMSCWYGELREIKQQYQSTILYESELQKSHRNLHSKWQNIMDLAYNLHCWEN